MVFQRLFNVLKDLSKCVNKLLKNLSEAFKILSKGSASFHRTGLFCAINAAGDFVELACSLHLCFERWAMATGTGALRRNDTMTYIAAVIAGGTGEQWHQALELLAHLGPSCSQERMSEHLFA